MPGIPSASLPPTCAAVPHRQVTILEARGRVGGRMWSRTSTAGGQTLRAEMGAQWIAGATGTRLHVR